MNVQIVYFIKIALAVLLSAIIGVERERSHKEAGLRTIMLIALGTVTFTLIPFVLTEMKGVIQLSFDFSRPISYTISGIGFLAGIVIVKGKGHLEGLTTAASIWAVVAMSMMIGLGQYVVGVTITFFIWLILKSKPITYKIKEGG